ncbi:hypothetical protein C8Q80DRAFT_1358204 [Daedaleopsis nitida]|nr:hypothetical protein C8Q80DRAFT_1358204 [Daedaleopsis nitida]
MRVSQTVFTLVFLLASGVFAAQVKRYTPDAGTADPTDVPAAPGPDDGNAPPDVTPTPAPMPTGYPVSAPLSGSGAHSGSANVSHSASSSANSSTVSVESSTTHSTASATHTVAHTGNGAGMNVPLVGAAIFAAGLGLAL